MVCRCAGDTLRPSFEVHLKFTNQGAGVLHPTMPGRKPCLHAMHQAGELRGSSRSACEHAQHHNTQPPLAPTWLRGIPVAARLSFMSRLLRMPMMLRGRPTGDSAQKQLSLDDTWDAYLEE